MATAMGGLSLAKGVARELGMPAPRTVAGLRESTGWAPLSPRGARQFGEPMLDELVLSVQRITDRFLRDVAARKAVVRD